MHQSQVAKRRFHLYKYTLLSVIASQESLTHTELPIQATLTLWDLDSVLELIFVNPDNAPIITCYVRPYRPIAVYRSRL